MKVWCSYTRPSAHINSEFQDHIRVIYYGRGHAEIYDSLQITIEFWNWLFV